MTIIENQFDDEPYDQPPDPNKDYWCTSHWTSTGFTHLMKRVLLSNKIPLVLTTYDVKEINQQNTEGWTALMIACRNSNTNCNQETVKTLIKAGADLNITDDNGFTALMYVCNSNTDNKQETVEALIKAGADLNIKSNYGSTALILICENFSTTGSFETIDALIKAGADLNIKNNHLFTALMYACIYSNIDSKHDRVEALIKAGAELCYYDIIELNSNYVYKTIINRHQHNPTKIEPILNHICPELKDKYEYYQRCVTNIKSITEYQIEIYYQPNNIGALLCQTNFESKRNINYCSHKLLFLFAKN